MALAPEALLDLIDGVIQKRLAGDAYESYTEQQDEFRGTPLPKLFEIRRQLQAEIAAGSGNFALAELFDV